MKAIDNKLLKIKIMRKNTPVQYTCGDALSCYKGKLI